MKKPRTAVRSLSSGLLGILTRTCLVAAPVVLAGSAMVACADENDPKTWVKRLDDPAQRSAAIKRLDEMFNAAMGSESNNREAPKVKAVVDDSIEALAKTYTTGGLDEKTRKDLIKLIADMGDPRAAPAFAKAFKDYEPGKNDEDVKFAAQGTSRLSTSGKLTDQQLIDALWDCFAKFQPSKAKSINLVKDLQSAVKTVKHPSWGPKAVALLNAPVTDPKNPEQGMDQLQFWQLTSVQLIGDTKFTAGVGPLVKVLMTPTKKDLTFPVRLALHKMPKEAEPELIKALKGEGDYEKLAEAYPEKAYLPFVAEPLAYISRPAGLAAIQEALAKADNDSNRTFLATYLTYFPTDPKNVKAYTDAYAKIAPNAAIPLMGGANGHAILAGTAANFFDPSLTEWILKEVANAKGEAADAMPASGLPAAIKLMTVEQAKAVGEAVDKIPGQAIEKDMFKSASAVLDKCKKDAACYLGVLDTPVPSAPPAAKMGHVKAVWMAVELHPDDTRVKLMERVEKVKDGSVRLAILEGIDTLSPNGDAAIADKLEKLVETERAAGNAAGTDEMYRIALKLRSRVP
ncbi:MAG: hypothetical protein KIS78_06540 [Labilithrix sp.]|nr:hypothetical protein [Labilithrix sp.]MCW5832095.1 hypothetical protein [Labilithrix sp.]